MNADEPIVVLQIIFRLIFALAKSAGFFREGRPCREALLYFTLRVRPSYLILRPEGQGGAWY
jgi:hypothetical protein